MKFSEKLTKLRKENNLSQEALADKLDVSRQSVSKWESGQTYPEMDKLLTLCKLFNITLDDLTNDNINYNDVKTKKGAFDSILGELTYIINKSFNMFKSMSGKQKIKTIGELIIIFLILLLFRIPFEYLIDLGENLTNNHNNLVFLSNIWTFLIEILYLIAFIFTYLYIYKTNYLDKYELIEVPKKESKEKDDTENVETANETKKQIIIKEKYPSPLFKTLGKIFNISLKVFIGFIGIPFILSLLFITIYTFITIYLLFTGVTYFGFTIVGIGAIIINLLILILIISFLFNHKPSFKKLFILFISGIIITGSGIGLCIVEVMNTELINEAPKTKLKVANKTFDYDYTDNLIQGFINDYDENYNLNLNVNVVADDTLDNTIVITASYYEDLTYFEIYRQQEGSFQRLFFNNRYKSSKSIINILIDNLKDKKIYNYEELYKANVTIKASSTTLEKLKNNWKNYEKEIAENNDKIDYCYDNLNDSYLEQNRLQEIIDEKDQEINELTNKNIELEEKVKEIENKIKELLNN